MNRSKKNFCMALALAATLSAFAAEEPIAEEEETGAVGWTPIAFGIASPVQLPWGLAKWDVFGLDLNVLYSDAPKMYGLGIGGLAMTTRDDLIGLQISGLCNWNSKDIYGMRVTAGANISFGEGYGLDVGTFAYRTAPFWGVDIELIGSYETEVNGLQIGGLLNLAVEKSYGCVIAIGGNMSKVAYGAQVGGIFNFTDELHGAQIGLVNFARECPWGFQIGLVNIIMDNQIKVLPIVNGYF